MSGHAASLQVENRKAGPFAAALQEIDTVLDRPRLEMLDLLPPVERVMHLLLEDEAAWTSLCIEWQNPLLMRMWQAFGPIRIQMHYFFAAHEMTHTPGSTVYHPHEWATAMRILEGGYTQRVGFAARTGLNPDYEPPYAYSTQLVPGSTYAMNNPRLWHETNLTLGVPASTLMLSYKLPEFAANRIRPDETPRALSADEKEFMFGKFRRFYPPPTETQRRHTCG